MHVGQFNQSPTVLSLKNVTSLEPDGSSETTYSQPRTYSNTTESCKTDLLSTLKAVSDTVVTAVQVPVPSEYSCWFQSMETAGLTSIPFLIFTYLTNNIALLHFMSSLTTLSHVIILSFPWAMILIPVRHSGKQRHDETSLSPESH